MTSLSKSLPTSHRRLWEQKVAEQIGAVVLISLATERRAWRLATIQAFVEAPVRLNQIELLMDDHGRAQGYVTWGFLTDSVQLELASNPARLIDFDEWNAGTHLWILDVVAPSGGLFQLLKKVRMRLPDHNFAHWLKRHKRASDCLTTQPITTRKVRGVTVDV
jgi:cytolysin-activating lysine-acyltransferase